MDDAEYDKLTREYGLEDMEDYERWHMEIELAGNAQQASSANSYYAAYDDIEDFEDDTAFSSPSPPERALSRFQPGHQTQYRPSQNTCTRQPRQASGSFSQAWANVLPENTGTFAGRREPISRQIHHCAPPVSERETQHTVLSQPYPTLRTDPRPPGRAVPQSKRLDREDHTSHRGSNPRNTHGIRLRPTSDLPDVYRALFKFGVFNAVQSTCYDKVMNSDDNMVISAPTGSGKTALFELAIIRMLMESSNSGRQSKCIYVAPTKALCSEKHRDWTIKFQALGVNCCELTGDTVQFGRSAWGEAKNAAIIVTTGEKWDSLTRNWEEHQQILSQITLFLIDEIHILNETRGSTLEVVVSRMKLRGTSVRFVAVSATVPNVQDVAAWLGNERNGGSAVIMEFGEEYRPCKIVRHVVPVLKKRDQNDFQFQRILDYKLYGVLQQYSQDKPVLIFCATRKGVVASAEQLMKEYGQSLNKRDRLPWTKPGGISHRFHDNNLERLAICGIGIHHAGLTWDDRRAMEDLFLKKVLRVIVATSTLAVGVNLPAHTVIIKGVKIFATDGWQEYSDLDIMQMMGRAGRPQFDKEGVAIIMCETELEAKYQALVQGRTFLESCLHNNLAEHINSEIGLGTITNINSAKEWLHSSFLFQRIQQNPRHYAIGKEGNQTWQERIDNMVTESIERLRENQLVELSNDDSSILKSTEYGDIMSKYYIRQSTMALILHLPERATLKDMLEVLASAEEFFDIKIRAGEKQIYGKLKAHDEIRFKMKKVEKALDKISLIIQAVLAGLSLNDGEYKNGDNQPSLEAVTIWRHVSRIARAMVEVAIARQCGAQVKHGMELMRCLSAKAWEDRPVVLRQIDQIGDKSIKVLVQHGITTLQHLRKQEPARLEVLLNRRPTFGHEVLAFVKSLPEYYIQVEEVGTTLSDGASPVEIELSVTVGVNEDTGVDSGKFKKGKAKLRDSTTILSLNSELDFIDFRRISTKMLKPPKTFTITAHLTKPSQSVIVQIASETIAGVAVTYTYKPKLAYRAYPTMITRPQTTLERDLEGIEDDAAFWEAMKDWPSDDEEVVKKDLTPTLSSSNVASQPSKPNTTLRHLSSQRAKEGQKDETETVSTSPMPKILPNGNYACSHPCKDKTACKHLCCREGLSKPPAWKKKRVEALHPVEGQLQKAEKLEQKTNHKVTLYHKPDRRLKQLEALHRGTNVNASIQLREGWRIKLDDGTPASRHSDNKKRKAPNFDLAFTDLTAGEVAFADEMDELQDSGDELPDTHDILAAFNRKEGGAGTSTLSSRYSDPEVDELIRNISSPVALELTLDGVLSSPPRDPSSQDEDYDLTTSSPPPATSTAPKRPREPEDNLPGQLKRLKTAKPVLSVPRDKATSGAPLFWVASSDSGPSVGDNDAEADQVNKEEFHLDESLFDVRSGDLPLVSPVVARATTPPRLPVPACQREIQAAPVPSFPKPQANSDVRDLAPLHQDIAQEEPHPWDIAMAEFAEWLESDAIVVVENGN